MKKTITSILRNTRTIRILLACSVAPCAIAQEPPRMTITTNLQTNRDHDKTKPFHFHAPIPSLWMLSARNTKLEDLEKTGLRNHLEPLIKKIPVTSLPGFTEPSNKKLAQEVRHAIQSDWPDLFKLVLYQAATNKIPVTEESFNELLYEAIKTCDLENHNPSWALELLLSRGHQIKQSELENALMLANDRWNIPAIKRLAGKAAREIGFQVRGPFFDRFNQNPLHSQIFEESITNKTDIDALFNNKTAKSDLEQSAWEGLTPLHIAAHAGNYGAAQALLEWGVSANIQDNYQITPLHDAASCGHLAIAELLIKHGAQIDQPGHECATPLYHAAVAGQTAMIKYLLKKGANPEACSNYRVSLPMAAAIANGHAKAVKTLLPHHLDEHEKQKNKVEPLAIEYTEDPLLEAARIGDPTVLEAVLEHPETCLNAYDNATFKTALHEAVDGNNLTCAKMLLEKKVLTNVVDENDETELAKAARKNLIPMIKLLLEHTSSEHKLNSTQIKQFETTEENSFEEPFLVALRNGNIQAAELIMHHPSTDLCAHDQGHNYTFNHENDQTEKIEGKERTAVHYTVQHKNSVMLKYLLSHGAKNIMHNKDADGKTALDYAQETSFQEGVALLKKYTQKKSLSIEDFLVPSDENGSIQLSSKKARHTH